MNPKTWLRPLPRAVTRPISLVILLAWAIQMGFLVHRSYLQASVNLAVDLARYGSEAQWRGIYYRGAKVGFTVRQTVPLEDGFELQEDGQLEMTLLGAQTAAKLRTTARVDRDFILQSFEFSLDPGTGAVEVSGRVEPPVGDSGLWQLTVGITTSAGTRTEVRELDEPPVLPINMGRRLASSGLTPGARHEWMIFDPATLTNMPAVLEVGERELIRIGSRPIPAFRVEMELAGMRITSWVTDTGEVVREDSPLGLMTVRESAERAMMKAVPGDVRTDMLAASAVVPVMTQPIAEPRDVLRVRLRVAGVDLSNPDLQGVGQTVEGNVIELVDPRTLEPGPADADAARYLQPEPLIESDAPEILAEAELAVAGLDREATRARAEALTRYVNALIEEKPTLSLPSALEVLRTKIGDCNEHTALYVAMARALGIPARISVGLVYVRGAFYYHAWPEVYLPEGEDRGLWLPVDPTFNQFPADGMHLRLARGGLEKQAAILPLIGQVQLTVLDVEFAPDSVPILVGGP